MKRIIVAIGFCAMLAASGASHAQPENRAVLAKQQLSECMSRRMSASKTVSYNEAMRACKQQLTPPKETLASNPTGETAAPGR
jgi:hypothetical protein